MSCSIEHCVRYRVRLLKAFIDRKTFHSSMGPSKPPSVTPGLFHSDVATGYVFDSSQSSSCPTWRFSDIFPRATGRDNDTLKRVIKPCLSRMWKEQQWHPLQICHLNPRTWCREAKDGSPGLAEEKESTFHLGFRTLLNDTGDVY